MPPKKVIAGTQDRGTRVVKSTYDTRKIRCRCGGLAIAAPDGKGGTHHQCITCKTVLKTTVM